MEQEMEEVIKPNENVGVKRITINFSKRFEKFDLFTEFVKEKVVSLQEEYPYAEIHIEVFF